MRGTYRNLARNREKTREQENGQVRKECDEKR